MALARVIDGACTLTGAHLTFGDAASLDPSSGPSNMPSMHFWKTESCLGADIFR